MLDAKNADLRVARAWTLFYMGRSEEALAGFADAIRIDPKAAGRYRSRALALVKLGRYDEALADYDAAVKIEPARGINYASREYVYEYRGEPLAGLPDIERGRIADPEFAEASNWRGVSAKVACAEHGRSDQRIYRVHSSAAEYFDRFRQPGIHSDDQRRLRRRRNGLSQLHGFQFDGFHTRCCGCIGAMCGWG